MLSFKKEFILMWPSTCYIPKLIGYTYLVEFKSKAAETVILSFGPRLRVQKHLGSKFTYQRNMNILEIPFNFTWTGLEIIHKNTKMP